MRIRFTIIIYMLYSSALFAQQVKNVVGEYTYHAPENVSIEKAKRTALERAQLEAITETFGTDFSQHNSTRVSNRNGNSDVDFFCISSSDLKGEWIKTIGEPEFTIRYEQGMLIVKCKVKGNIRKIVSTAIDIKAKVLRNGTEDRFESSEFRSGDDIYLSFESPVDGYLVVYLLDEDGNVFCLLPYRNQTNGIYEVKANIPYIFFSMTNAANGEKNIVDEYTLTCERYREYNQMYIIFSPTPFVKCSDAANGKTMPRRLQLSHFEKWLQQTQLRDVNMQILKFNIFISKQ